MSTSAGETNNRITVGSVLYDAAGNLTRDGSGLVTMAYDAASRMTSLTHSGMASNNRTYGYDGEGRRVLATATSTGKRRVFVYDAFGRMAAEYDKSAPVSTGSISYLTTDHLGSTRAVSNAAGSVAAYYDCLWGADSGVKQEFTAKERDDESGLDYFGARYFSASLGRFTSADLGPLREADPQSLNRYAYVRNNPLRLIDESGNYWVEAVKSSSGQLKYLLVRRHEANVDAGTPVVPTAGQILDNFARQRTGDTNDQFLLPFPNFKFLGRFADFIPVEFESTLGEKGFSEPVEYSLSEGRQLDSDAFAVATPLLGVSPERKITGGVVSFEANPQVLGEFRKVHRGVRISQELLTLREKLRREDNAKKRERINKNIREREQDVDYQFLLERIYDYIGAQP